MNSSPLKFTKHIWSKSVTFSCLVKGTGGMLMKKANVQFFMIQRQNRTSIQVAPSTPFQIFFSQRRTTSKEKVGRVFADQYQVAHSKSQVLRLQRLLEENLLLQSIWEFSQLLWHWHRLSGRNQLQSRQPRSAYAEGRPCKWWNWQCPRWAWSPGLKSADTRADTTDDDNDNECNMFQQSQVFILHSLRLFFWLKHKRHNTVKTCNSLDPSCYLIQNNSLQYTALSWDYPKQTLSPKNNFSITKTKNKYRKWRKK